MNGCDLCREGVKLSHPTVFSVDLSKKTARSLNRYMKPINPSVMKRRNTIAIGLLSVLFFTACKKEASINIDQNRIYSDYEVTYDQESNRTEVQATFRVDHNSGTKVELTYPSRVGFNEESMAWRKLAGIYEAHFSGNLTHGAFTYFDADGNRFDNAGLAVNPIDLPYGMNNISKNGNFFLPWTGAALQQDETVEVVINGGSQSGKETFQATVVGSSYISLPQYKLDRLEVGTARIQISRQKTSTLQQSNLAGGRITSKYESREIMVNITE